MGIGNVVICRPAGGLKGRGWSKIAIMHISVNNQWIFTKFSAVVHYVISYSIIKFQLICIIYAWISHNSKVPNGTSMRSAILRKLITVNTCFLQLHVPYTLVGAIAILKFVETGLIFCKGPFKCYVTLFFWKLDPHPPPRNANNIEHYTFVTLFSRKSDTPHPHLRYVTLEWPQMIKVLKKLGFFS